MAAQLPNSNAPMPASRPSPPALQHRAHLQADRPPLPRARSPTARDGRRRASRRPRAVPARSRRASPCARRTSRSARSRAAAPADRSQVVRRALEPVGPSVRLGRHHVGEDRVAARPAHAARSPGAGSQHEHLPRRRREPDRCSRAPRSSRLAADRDLSPRRCGSSASAPPPSFATPAAPSATPSISPNADAGAPSVTVRKLGSSDVGISWPTSDRKLASPMSRTPDVSHRSVAAGGRSGSSIGPRVSLPALPPVYRRRWTPRSRRPD